MLHEFLTTNREQLVTRCREKVAQRTAPSAREGELDHGIGYFLDQLIRTLELERTAHPDSSRRVSGRAGGTSPGVSEIGEAASKHGRELLRHGFTIDQVVHDYGDLCQSVTDLACDLKVPFETDEFRTLNRCLDNAIADAVTEFTYLRDSDFADKNASAVNERLGFLAHELRTLLNSAALALTAIKSGNVGLNGATGAVLDRSLAGLRTLIDRSLADVRITAALPIPSQLFSLADLIADAKHSAVLEAEFKGCSLQVAAVDHRLALNADRDLISSALTNLLQNAFKFTQPRTSVRLNAYAVADRIRIDVEDHCGGLSEGNVEKMFLPFVRCGQDLSGLGLGLALSRRSVELFGGTLTAQDLPGVGCVFTVNLPRFSMPSPARKKNVQGA
jgi:signal transduction histidine kinase